MNVNRLLGILAIPLLIAASALYAQKPVKVKGVQGRWQVSDDVTLKQTEGHAFMEAKRAALQRVDVVGSVWSILGQITQKDGRELHEAYSQINVLAIGGMMDITNKKVEEVWDTDTRSLYKVVTINAEVQKEGKPDSPCTLEVEGVETLYCKGDVFRCKLTVHGADSYLEFFWFDSDGGALLYPNSYEPNTLLRTDKEYSIPFSNAVDYRMEKQHNKESEKINMMMVATKEDIPFTKEVTYQDVLEWVYSAPAVQRCASYDMVPIKWWLPNYRPLIINHLL